MVSVQLVLISLVAILLPEVYGEGKSVKFHNCNSRYQIKEVRVDPCETSGQRCPLKKGTSPRVSVTFTPNKEVRNLTATVHGIIASIPTEFPLSNRNGCSNSGLTCPLAAGQEYTYTQTVPVLSSYPNLQLLIRWALDYDPPTTGEDKKSHHDVCFIIQASLVD